MTVNVIGPACRTPWYEFVDDPVVKEEARKLSEFQVVLRATRLETEKYRQRR